MGAEAYRPLLDPTVVSLRARLRRVAEVPALFRLERFVSRHEADAIVALGGQVERGELDLEHKHDSTGFSVELPTERFESVAQVQRRIAALVGVPWHVEHSMRFRHYVVGEEHPAHVDNYQLGTLDLLVTAMVVLRAPTAGGRTAFPLADGAGLAPIAVAPNDRELILWLNHRADGTPEPASSHVAEAVSAGEKITLTNFMYLPSAVAAGPVHAILGTAAKGAP
jgi:hypothetical protein